MDPTPTVAPPTRSLVLHASQEHLAVGHTPFSSQPALPLTSRRCSFQLPPQTLPAHLWVGLEPQSDSIALPEATC